MEGVESIAIACLPSGRALLQNNPAPRNQSKARPENMPDLDLDAKPISPGMPGMRRPRLLLYPQAYVESVSVAFSHLSAFRTSG